MRVGINTGPAHLGAVGAGGEFTAMGDTVNVASRVQGLAPLGGVLVTHDTYRHVRGVFDVEPHGAGDGEGQGRTDPRVRRAPSEDACVPHADPRRGGRRDADVGRADELDVLRAEFERVVSQPETRRVTVIGEAGIGKSRLLYEFENWIELHPARAYFFKGRAVPTRRSAPFGLVRDLLADRFGVLDSDSASSVATSCAAVSARRWPPARPTSSDTGSASTSGRARRCAACSARGSWRATARAHLFRYLESLATEEPVVMFLEDLHWADDESLALVDELVDQCSRSPPARSSASDGRRCWNARSATTCSRRSSVAMRLAPLGPDSTRTLVGEILQQAVPVPDELTDLIVERADGNAFYVEELVKMLIEDGVIETGEPWDPWRVHVERLDPARVPRHA